MVRLVVTKAEIQEIIDYHKKKPINSNLSRFEKGNFIKKAKKFVVVDKILYIGPEGKRLRVVGDDDTEKQKEIFLQVHLPNHIGMTATYYEVADRYAGFKRARMDALVKSCEECQRVQQLKVAEPIKSIVAEKPWERI